MFSKMMVRAQGVIAWLRKKFREIQFKRILQHIWEWIKGLNRNPPIAPGDENVPCETSPEEPHTTHVDTPHVELPELYKDFSKWDGNILEFLKYRLSFIVNIDYTYCSTLKAFILRIARDRVYRFYGNAEIYLTDIDPIRVISETLNICGISMEEEYILEIVKSRIPIWWARMLLCKNHYDMRCMLGVALDCIANAVYAKIDVATAA